MKTGFVCVFLLAAAAVADATMFRVVQVSTSRSIVVEFAGKLQFVTLRNVNIAPEDEARAADYLRKSLADRWVYIENGDVYRSPDALFMNDAMRRRAWLGVRVLGEFDPITPRKGVAVKSAPPRKKARKR